MNGKRTLCIAIGLATAPAALPAFAQAVAAPATPAASPAPGLTELTDEEMGDMRGRYTVSSTSVAWFGVTMVSTWQNQAGQQLTSSMKVTMDGRLPDKPVVTFQPHVSITAIDAALPAMPGGQREIDNAGLANVTGVTQGIQVAGDGNAAHNVAKVTVRDAAPTGEGAAPAAAAPAASTVAAAPVASLPDPVASASTLATASAAGMNAVAQLDGNAARVLLQIDGHGAVEQWINRSGMGQTIMLSSDGQTASNWMELDIVRNTSQARAGVAQNVAQAIALSRGIAVGY